MKNFKNKPLTPHITIYKTENFSLYSIWHRVTGSIILAFLCFNSWVLKMFNWGVILWWDYILYGLLIKYNLLFFINLYLFLLYHVLNGFRHLVWDVSTHFNLRFFIVYSYLIIFFIWAAVKLVLKFLKNY